MIKQHTFNVLSSSMYDKKRDLKQYHSYTMIMDELSFLAKTFDKDLDVVVDEFNEWVDYKWWIK